MLRLLFPPQLLFVVNFKLTSMWVCVSIPLIPLFIPHLIPLPANEVCLANVIRFKIKVTIDGWIHQLSRTQTSMFVVSCFWGDDAAFMGFQIKNICLLAECDLQNTQHEANKVKAQWGKEENVFSGTTTKETKGKTQFQGSPEVFF